VFCDIHSHILWETDDGAQSREQSLAMLSKACDDGIKHIIATPHFIPGIYEPSARDIYDRVNTLNLMAQEQGIDITVHPGCEMSADKVCFNLLAENKIPTLCGSRYVLLELSEVYTKDSIINIINDITAMGYTPVIAHAERSISYRHGTGFIKKLIDKGALIQINATSLILPHVSLAQRFFMRKMIKGNMVFAVATDCHSDTQRPPVLSSAERILQKYAGVSGAEQMLLSNPMKIVESTFSLKG